MTNRSDGRVEATWNINHGQIALTDFFNPPMPGVSKMIDLFMSTWVKNLNGNNLPLKHMLISPVEHELLTLLTVHLRHLHWGSKAESMQNPQQLKTFATGIDQKCVICENLLIHHLHSMPGLHHFSHLGKILNTEKTNVNIQVVFPPPLLMLHCRDSIAKMHHIHCAPRRIGILTVRASK